MAFECHIMSKMGPDWKNRWKIKLLKRGGPVWVKLRKSVIFFKDTVFWGATRVRGVFDGFGKDSTKWGDYWRILEKFGVKGFFP
jgi:hypothetical protein